MTTRQPLVLIVEAHAHMRSLLCDMVHAACAEARCLTPQTGAEAALLGAAHRPDLILFDTDMRQEKAGVIARVLQQLRPEARWIVLSQFEVQPDVCANLEPHTWLAKHTLHTHLLPVLTVMLSAVAAPVERGDRYDPPTLQHTSD